MSTSTVVQTGTASVALTPANEILVDIDGVALRVAFGYAFGYGDALTELARHGWAPDGPVVIPPGRGYVIPVRRTL